MNSLSHGFMRVPQIAKAAGYLAAVLALLTPIDAAKASTPAPVFGTGQDQAYTPGERDSRWKVVAAPAGFAPEAGDSIPPGYNSYLYEGPGCAYAPAAVGGFTYRCISWNPTGQSPTVGNWIFKQTFNVNTQDDYLFNFLATADNRLRIFVGGSVDATTDPDYPTIAGGQSIGGEVVGGPGGFLFESRWSTLNLSPGEYQLYAVVTDEGGSGSFILANNPNPPGAPAPLPIFGAAAAFGASRRLKRRIRVARLSVSTKAG